MYTRILVAIDDGAPAQRALEHAASLARSLSASLRVLHVVDMGWLTLGPELALDVDSKVEERTEAGEALLAAASERLLAAGVEAETGLADGGLATEGVITAIGAEAAAWRADVVVLGRHGRRGVQRLALGSVAEGVARRSAVPVLLGPWHETGS